MLKLDLGAGDVSPDGFIPLGNINGTQIFPLPYADGAVDNIRASHVLEHFPHRQVPSVLADWARALKPGGTLSIAVPDFQKIAENYLSGVPQNTVGYVMGGQIDEADFHKSQFDEETLRRSLAAAGLMLVRRWTSELPSDCAALPISLNLSATKPFHQGISASAVMSVPRLGFMENMFSALEAFGPLSINVRRHTGAFWEQCIERVIEEAIRDEAPDLIITVDYDTVFTKRDVQMLMQLMCCYPDADAIAPVQAGRGTEHALFTVRGPTDSNLVEMPVADFGGDLTKVATAHFGLTAIRTEKIKAIAKPWFRSAPSDSGDWNDGHVDADIAFWRAWEAAGNTLFLANRVPVGHLELGVLWPGRDLKQINQPVKNWRRDGKPAEAWQ